MYEVGLTNEEAKAKVNVITKINAITQVNVIVQIVASRTRMQTQAVHSELQHLYWPVPL